jgi:hypothetical protein
MNNITTLEGSADEIMGALAVFLTGGLPEENGAKKMKPLPTDPAKREAYRDRAIERAVDAYYDHDTSDKTLHKIGRSLHDIRVRDVLIREMLIHGEGFEENLLDYLTRVADRVHPSDAAPILTICALVEWLRGDEGNKPMMHAFMMGAAEADPDYSLLMLLRVAAGSGMPADDWANTMRSLTYDDCRYGSGE